MGAFWSPWRLIAFGYVLGVWTSGMWLWWCAWRRRRAIRPRMRIVAEPGKPIEVRLEAVRRVPEAGRGRRIDWPEERA